MKRFIFPLMVLYAACFSCTNSNNAPAPQQEKQETKTEKRNIIKKPLSIPSEFSYITNVGSVNVIFTPGDYNITVEGDSALLPYVSTNFDSNILTVSLQGDANKDINLYGANNLVTMHISAPSLECASVCGTGNFVFDGKWESESIQIGSLDNGSITLGEVECKHFKFEATSKANVSIKHLKADDAMFNFRFATTFTADVDIERLTVYNDGSPKLTLTGNATNLYISKPKDANLSCSIK